ILDQILAGSSPTATYATADGKIVAGPNHVASSLQGTLSSANNVIESDVCHSQCLGGCSGPGPNNCKACHHYSLEGECVGSCPEGTYGSDSRECLGCYESCSLCSGPAQNQCLACRPGLLYVVHLGICVESCAQGYYSADGNCLHCDIHCSECSGPEYCSECYHHLLLANGSCLTNCPKGFYETQDNKCKSCHPQCETCVGVSESSCASCRSNSYLYQGRCVFRCPQGTYGDELTGECHVCSDGCSTCNDGDSCSSCIDGWRIKAGHCVASSHRCNINEFATVNGACQRCHSTCLSCVGTGESQCLHCTQRRFLLDSKCVESCPESYFAVRGRCLPCPNGCLYCTSYGDCRSCAPRFHLHNNKCIASCPEGFYSDIGVCRPCEATCRSCYGPRTDQCASCHNESFLLGSACHRSCPDSHYPERMKCVPCYNNCRTCKGSGLTDCTTCHDYLTLDGGMCIECRSGRYYNLTLKSCESCHYSCLTCSSSGEGGCTSCQAPNSLHLTTGSCRPCCPEGVTEDDHGPPCCTCDPATNQCYGAVSADKRRIALSLNSESSQTPYRGSYLFTSVTSLIAVICLVNVLLFGAVFAVLQARSSGSLCWSRDYSYRSLKSANMTEKVSLTLMPYIEEEDSEDERERDILYMKT
ncbi:serine-type endopeptidase activity protein, partial [Halocaridina rubra]